MATTCISSATATTTSFITTESLLTTFTESVSTETPTVTTITTEECALGSLSAVGCLSTATTITSTIPGITTTIQVPVTTSVSVTSSETLTLFGSSCTVISSAPPGGGVSGGNVSQPVSTITPDPLTFTSTSQTTLSNGQVSVIVQTLTSTQQPSVVYVATDVPGPGQEAQNNTDSSSSSHIGPIVGGVVGGFFLLLGVALAIWFVLKRRRRWDDIFDKEDPSPRSPRATKRFSLDTEIEPKPYQYGLVGQTRSPSVGISPPSSPSALSASQHSRQHTLPPLHLPSSASIPGPSATTVSSRPSTAGSMRPLRDPPVSGHSHNHTTSTGSSTSVHVAPAIPSHWGHHSPSPSAGQEYFERSGSPTSVRDHEPPRRLQLANAAEGDVGQSPPTPSPLLGPAMLDGKGRNVRLGSGGPGVLVHTDAGPAPSGFQP
ncbi:hypothetical protein C8R43DRAFT_1130871 [Mycena crocata]|nr:hypothetical protein C8R43DRAFT_1130871 [Mycena crocata]